MKKNISNIAGNLEELASLDFLDLCLLGETGTGKTHTAKLIHDLSPRSGSPMVSVNCAELSPSLIESELFGHEKGAFTGAGCSKEGKFEAATGGTLFLDEIGELDTTLQAKLLKVVEEKCVTRVGGNRPRPVDVRIVYATHRDLSVFREDIRYRVTSHALYLKPLRQRKEEIVPLAMGFLDGFNAKSGRRIRADRPVLNLLENDPWFGNIRELRGFVEKVCVDAIISFGKAAKCSEITLTREIVQNRLNKKVNGLEHSPSSPVSPGGWPPFVAGDKLEKYLERIETELLKAALENHKHNQTRAARELGISRSGLIKKLKRMEH